MAPPITEARPSSDGRREPVTWRRCGTWFTAAAAAVPGVTMLHELGHVGAYYLFGFQSIGLHYVSATASAASAHPPWQAALTFAAGPAVSVMVLLASCILVGIYGPHPVAVTTGLATVLRLPFVTASASLLYAGTLAPSLVVDEMNAGLGHPIAVATVILVEASVISAGAIWLLCRFLVCSRHVVTSTILGASAGAWVYLYVIGPVLLP